MACPVCIEDYNKTTRKAIHCAKCDFAACHGCYRRYICDSSSDPSCMSCKSDWDVPFLASQFPMSFITNALKKHREDQLYERELSLLPSTQPAVKRALRIRRYWDKCKELDKERQKLQTELRGMEYPWLQVDRRNGLLTQIAELRIECRNTKEKMYQYMNKKTEETNKPIYVRNCPAPDCRGFVDTKWHCGLCAAHVCKKCHEIKQEDHTCTQENIETAQLITRDSKPCPGCAVLIHRISGCNQMWCVNCGVAFDWQTLKIDKGHVHNPEYFKALQSGKLPFARANLDVCGNNLPADYVVISHVNGTSIDTYTKETLIEMYRHTRHLTLITRPFYANRTDENNEDLRVRYMLKELTQEKFKRALQQREKANRKNVEIVQVLDMVLNLSTGLFHDLIQSEEKDHMMNKKQEMTQLFQYGDECMDKIHHIYKCNVPYVSIPDML